MDILITGAEGFIGKTLADFLYKKGFAVHRFDIKDLPSYLAPLYIQEKLEEIESGKYDIVIHLGANSSTTETDLNKILYENFTMSKLFFEACKKRGSARFQYASSASVYGLAETFEEDQFCKPLSPYAFSKYMFDCWIGLQSYPYQGFRYFNCYDEKTEILTDSGFKFLKDVDLSDKVATLNPDTDFIEYHNPSEVHKVKHKGKMLHFKGMRTDLFCTPDQNLYVSRKNKNEGENLFLLKSAQSVVDEEGFERRLKTTGEWIGENREFEIIPSIKMEDGRQRPEHLEKKIPIKKWMAFMGWFLSEGSVFEGQLKSGNKYYRVNISQINNESYINEIYDISREIGFKPQRTYKSGGKIATGVTIHSKQLYSYLRNYKNDKFISREYLNLEKSALIELYKTLMKGDGDSDGRRYTTKYSNFADDFQELLLKIGKTGRVFKEISKKNNSEIYRISILNNTEPQLGNCERRKVNVSEVDFNDYVYDVTVKNHVIFIRRNGFACWSGNCYGNGEKDKGDQASPIFKFAKQARETGVIKLFEGSNSLCRDFVCVEDVCEMHLKFINAPNVSGVFNIGTCNPASFFEVAQMIQDKIPSKLEYIPFPKNLEGQYQEYTCADLTKLEEAIGEYKWTSVEEWIEKNIT